MRRFVEQKIEAANNKKCFVFVARQSGRFKCGGSNVKCLEGGQTRSAFFSADATNAIYLNLKAKLAKN